MLYKETGHQLIPGSFRIKRGGSTADGFLQSIYCIFKTE